MTVAGQVGSTVSLGNGCLCCAVDASELDDYLEKLTRPAARIDVIVIEASGLAEPQELVRMLLASDNPRIVYGGLVEVVDAAEFDATRARHPEIDRHLAIADLVVLNKTDRVGAGRWTGCSGRSPSSARGTPAITAPRTGGSTRSCSSTPPPGRSEETAASSPSRTCTRTSDHDHEHADHLHAAYESVDFTARRAHGPAPAHGLPRLPARRALPDQGIRRLRRGRPGQPVRRARRRPVSALLPASPGRGARSGSPSWC